MMGKLPALLGHLGGFRRLGFLAWTDANGASQSHCCHLDRPNFPWNFPARPQFGHQRLSRRSLFLAWPSCQCQSGCTQSLFSINGCTEQRDKEALSVKNREFICLMFYTFGTSLTLLFWKVWGNGKSGARAFANYAWIPSAERKKCLAALLVETTSTWFQVPSVLPIVPCRPIVFALLFFFLQIERKWMDAQPPMKVIYFSRPVLKKRKAALSNSVTQDALCDETSFKLHNLRG